MLVQHYLPLTLITFRVAATAKLVSSRDVYLRCRLFVNKLCETDVSMNSEYVPYFSNFRTSREAPEKMGCFLPMLFIILNLTTHGCV